MSFIRGQLSRFAVGLNFARPQLRLQVRLAASSVLIFLASAVFAQQGASGYLSLGEAVEAALSGNPHLASMQAHADALLTMPRSGTCASRSGPGPERDEFACPTRSI